MASSKVPAPTGENDAPVQLPKLGPRGWIRFVWRQLTSMQTALFLLMLLAIAAVPGSLYPQRAVDPSKTEAFLQNNGWWAKVLDKLGFFDVFTSPWFSAIYLLLFISLIGCVLPRCAVYFKQVRSRPPRTPRNLERFVGFERETIDATPAEVQNRAYEVLKKARYRVDRIDEGDGVLSVSAERGYLREAGNLIFHLALLGVLVGVGMGYLTSYRGQMTVIEGEGFANSLTRYDSYEPGPWFKEKDLPPFRLTLNKFRAEFSTDSRNSHAFGQPTLFEADVTVEEPTTGTTNHKVQVNEPLTFNGTGVYLLGNGYAPVLKVRDPNGTIVADGPVQTISRDPNYTSQLVLKIPDATPDQMAIVGIFAPTATVDDKGPHSLYAGLVDPAMYLTVYTGDLGLDKGIAQNVYQIDVSTLKQVTADDGTPLRIKLVPGETYTLPNGATIEFSDIKRYAAFNIHKDPWQTFTLSMALLAAAGLMASLFIPRRRMWVRARASHNGTELETAGLARSEDFRLDEDVRALAARLRGGTTEIQKKDGTE